LRVNAFLDQRPDLAVFEQFVGTIHRFHGCEIDFLENIVQGFARFRAGWKIIFQIRARIIVVFSRRPLQFRRVHRLPRSVDQSRERLQLQPS